MHFHIRRHSIDTIPTSDEDLENWCIEKWKEKEKTLEKFYQKDKCFHDNHQNGVTNNVQGKSTTIDRFVLWSVMGFWVIFAIFVPTLLWYSSLARYQVVIFGILMHLVNLLGGVEKLAFCTMSWRYGKTSKLFSWQLCASQQVNACLWMSVEQHRVLQSIQLSVSQLACMCIFNDNWFTTDIIAWWVITN